MTCCRSSWICICSCWSCDGCGAPPRRTLDSCCSNSAMGSTDSRPEGDSADRPPPDELKCILERLERGPPRARPECGIRRTPPCRIADGSSRNEIRSREPLRCSRLKCPAKSSVTRLGSPPGRAAHTGQTTSRPVSVCSELTCSSRAESLSPIRLQYGQVNDCGWSGVSTSPP